MEKLIQTQQIPSNGHSVQNKYMLNTMTPENGNIEKNKTENYQLSASPNKRISMKSDHLQGKMSSKKKTPQIWTPQDYELLYEAYFIHGAKWTKLAYILSKSDNAVKNKFYAQIRKLLRKLCYISKTIKPRKSITYQALIRPIEAQDYHDEPYPGYNNEKNELKKNIINFSRYSIEELTKQECQQLIDDIHYFNLRTRSYNLKSPRNDAEDKRSETSTVQGGYKQERGEQNSVQNNLSQKCFSRMMSNAQIEKLYEQVAQYEIKNDWEMEMVNNFHLLI